MRYAVPIAIRFVTTCFFFSFSYLHASTTEESFLLINGITNEVLVEFGPNIYKQMSPCSTFKIPLSLMGYDTAILQDKTSPLWDFQEGYEDWFTAWKTPQTPSTWIKYSCVWYSKILSLKLGVEKIQNYLISLEYGNQDVSGGLVEPLWINSSLKISLKEQVDFIQKMIRGQLPVSKRAIYMTKTLLFREKLTDDWQLFGKTGCCDSDIDKDGTAMGYGWFVGWVEKDQHFYPFAYLIRGKKINLDQSMKSIKELLVDSCKRE